MHVMLLTLQKGPPWSWSYGSWIVQLPLQSLSITTEDVSSNPAQVYSIQHYVIKFVIVLRQVGGFLRVLRFPVSIKLTATIWLTCDVTWVPDKVIFRSVTAYNKNVSGQGKLSAQIEQVQNKMKYTSIWLWS